MSSYRILNTRPAHQADEMTRLIENKGGFVFNLPVFDIQLVQFNADNLDKFDYVVFLSANAVASYFKKQALINGCAIAIGPATKSALEKIGIKNSILPSQFNSEGVLLMPEMQFIKNKKIAIICGENSKSLLPETLKKRGADINLIICYRRIPMIYDMSVVFKKLTDSNINCIVSTSLESYFALLSLFKNVEYRTWLLKKTICVISDEMQHQATTDGFSNVVQAGNATDEAIIRALA